MKKSLLVLLIALVTLCSCVKDDSAKMGRTISLYATHNASRASFADNKTSWIAGDALTVLFADAEGNYGPYQFTLSGSSDESRFSCNNVTLGNSESYNVYALHQPTLSVEGNIAKISIGSASQTQIGSTTDHVAQYDPLYGVDDSAKETDINISMEHMASILSFTLKNDTDADIPLHSVYVSTSSGVAIAESCDFNLQSGQKSNCVIYDGLTLNFKNSSSDDSLILGAGESLKAWVAVAPFSLSEGESLNFGVRTANDKYYTFTKNIYTATTFAAGEILNMAQPISLGSDSQLPESKEVVIDFSTLNNSEVGLPTTSSSSEYTGAGELFTYQIGSETISIISDAPFYYYAASTTLGFDFSGADQNSLLYLPKCRFGLYKISKVVVNFVNPNSDFYVGITDCERNLVNGVELSKLGTAKSKTFTLEGLSATEQYCFYAQSIKATKCRIAKITITYSL